MFTWIVKIANTYAPRAFIEGCFEWYQTVKCIYILSSYFFVVERWIYVFLSFYYPNNIQACILCSLVDRSFEIFWITVIWNYGKRKLTFQMPTEKMKHHVQKIPTYQIIVWNYGKDGGPGHICITCETWVYKKVIWMVSLLWKIVVHGLVKKYSCFFFPKPFLIIKHCIEVSNSWKTIEAKKLNP